MAAGHATSAAPPNEHINRIDGRGHHAPQSLRLIRNCSSCGRRLRAAEAQTHELVVERIQFAHGRNVHEFVAKQHDVPLKRTLRGDQADDEAGNGLVAGVERIQPMLQRFKRMKVQGACWSITRLQSLQR